MRLDGALKPHRGAPNIGSSIGVVIRRRRIEHQQQQQRQRQFDEDEARESHSDANNENNINSNHKYNNNYNRESYEQQPNEFDNITTRQSMNGIMEAVKLRKPLDGNYQNNEKLNAHINNNDNDNDNNNNNNYNINKPTVNNHRQANRRHQLHQQHINLTETATIMTNKATTAAVTINVNTDKKENNKNDNILIYTATTPTTTPTAEDNRCQQWQWIMSILSLFAILFLFLGRHCCASSIWSLCSVNRRNAMAMVVVVVVMVMALALTMAILPAVVAVMTKILMRVEQSLVAFIRVNFKLLLATLATLSMLPLRFRQRSTNIYAYSNFNMRLFYCLTVIAAVATLLPNGVSGDDDFFGVNRLSVEPETTTPEFDYASRGPKKFGDKCENTLECGFPGSTCDPKKKTCQCTEDLPVTNHFDKCGKEAAVNESCFFNEQCEVSHFQTECRDGRCICRFEMTPIRNKDGSVECKGRQDKRGTETYIDPAMIGVLVGMALMFIIICVVLRLFSQARWRENRTIFNTPNPRLMNVSLLRDSKLLHGQERRGSRMSVRGPSRQPSMASLRPHSPNPSLGKTGSRGSGSNVSATSVRSTRSNSVAPGHVVNNSAGAGSHHERKGSSYRQTHQQHHQQHQSAHQSEDHEHEQQQNLITNITANPAAESVTVEIMNTEHK